MYSVAISTVDAPSPQPMSATLAPERSLSSTPSSAGIQLEIRFPMYPGRKNRSQPVNTSSSCSCQPIPAPVRNASMICGSAFMLPSANWNAPGTNTAPSGLVSANACSSVSEYVSVAGSYST